VIPFHVLNANHLYNRSYKRRRRHELLRQIEANEREIEAKEREIEAITLSLQRKNQACQAQIAALNAD
jgi:hypothetical protein